MSFMIVTPHQILFEWANQEEQNGRRIRHLRVRGQLYTGIWCGKAEV